MASKRGLAIRENDTSKSENALSKKAKNCGPRLLLNMACTAFSNRISGNVCYSLKHFQNCVKQESVYFVICPKQGPSLEGGVPHSDTPLPKHGSSAVLPSPPPPPPSLPPTPRAFKIVKCGKNEF